LEYKRWPDPLIRIHWLTLGLIIAAIALVFARDAIEGKHIRTALLNTHKFIGIAIPFLALLRLALVMRFRSLLPQHPLSFVETWGARLVHFALYLAMLSVPMLGWAHANAHGDAVTLFGVIPLPTLVQEDMDLAETLADWHEYAAYTFIGLAGLHALAALWHHLFKKDAVLKEMAPFLK
jgi:cytochrome b561